MRTRHYLYEALALNKVTVDNTVGGKTLAQLGVTINANTRTVSLQPVDGTVYVALGTPTSASFEIPSTGSIELRALTKTLNTLKILGAAAAVKLNVLELGE